jgi:amino acid transporter
MIVGVRESAMLNKAFTLLNILVIAFIFVSGLFYADIKNWQFDSKSNTSWVDYEGKNQTCETSERCGEGGFLAFGFSGIIRGAAKCFYAYIGIKKKHF